MYSYTPGLGEVLPTIPVTGPNATSAAQYNALAAGGAAGGNFQHFKDGAAQGFFTDDAAGYGQYLAYNSLGTVSPELRNAPIEYWAWRTASVFAYAVVSGAHTGNNLSPKYTVAFGNDIGQRSMLNIAAHFGWDATQRQKGLDLFASNYTRLLDKWGYKAPGGGPAVLPPAPTMIEHPFFKAKGSTVWVDKATVTYDGPDDDPDTVGGRKFTAGGVTWRWGGVRKAVPPDRYLQIIVEANNPANPPKYDSRQVTMYPTLAWFVLSRGGIGDDGKPLGESRTPLTKWTGEWLNYSDTGPKGFLLKFEQLSAAEQAAVRALQGASTPPSKADWGWGLNTNVSTAPPQNAPIPITDPRNPNYRPPGGGGVTPPPAGGGPTTLPPPPPVSSNPPGTVNPWTDIAVPAPTPAAPFPVTPSGSLVRPPALQPPAGEPSRPAGPGPAAALPFLGGLGKVVLGLGVVAAIAAAMTGRRRRP